MNQSVNAESVKLMKVSHSKSKIRNLHKPVRANGELDNMGLSGKFKGFTLLELMVTLVIAGILASLALPMFTSTLARSRLTSHANLMIGALNYARSEAVNLNQDVTITINASGWEVEDAGSNTLKKYSPPSQDILTTASSASITYASTGFQTVATSKTITFCDPDKNGRQVSVAVSGSVSVSTITCP